MPNGSAEPCLFVLLGATGDLARRKLLIALYRLACHRRLGDRFQILGVSRTSDMDDASFRSFARRVLESAKVQAGDYAWACFETRLHYRSVGEGRADNFRDLAAEIEALERKHGLPGNRIFY